MSAGPTSSLAALNGFPAAQRFDELLQLASKGQHTSVDMLVKDIYGGSYGSLGLTGDLIASSFGKSATADKGDANTASHTVCFPPSRLALVSLKVAAASGAHVVDCVSSEPSVEMFIYLIFSNI